MIVTKRKVAFFYAHQRMVEIIITFYHIADENKTKGMPIRTYPHEVFVEKNYILGFCTIRMMRETK